MGGVLLLKITNVARDYAWGSKTLIPEYFGIQASGRPMAEIWFGTHPGSPTRTEGGSSLRETINHDLSFLLKILAAENPLSIQAHPTTAQAIAGFAAENADGIDLLSPNRNYKDASHKPEMLVALTDFQALCGFKPIAEIDAIFADFAEIVGLSDGFKETAAAWRLLLERDGLDALVADILGRREAFLGFSTELASLAEFEAQYELAAKLHSLHPGDPGVLLALLMNLVWLEPGQAIYLDAGQIHAYVSGLGVEVMAASDNVLRGGLTEKHIDVAELTKVLDFEPAPAQIVSPVSISSFMTEYPTAVSDFKLCRIEASNTIHISDALISKDAILLVTAGSVDVSSQNGEKTKLVASEAAYFDAAAGVITVSGTGTLFMATGPAAKR